MPDQEKDRKELHTEIIALRKRLATDGKVRQSLRRLYNSEQRMTQIFHAIPSAIAIVDLDDERILEINDGFGHLTGFSREEVVGRALEEINYGIGIDYSSLICDLLQGKRVQNREYAVRTKGGEIRHGLMSADLIRFEGRLCVITAGVDITERRRVEKSLDHVKRRLASIFNASPIPTCLITTADRRFLDVNRAFLQTLGLSRQEVVGRSVTDLDILLEDASMPNLAILLSGVAVRDLEVMLKDKSGRVKHFLLSTEPYNLGDEVCVIAAGIDITERKLAQQALQQSEERFYSIFQATPSLMAIVRLDNLKLVAVNESFLTHLGYREDEVVGRTADELELWVDEEKRVAARERVKSTGRLDCIEIRVRRRDRTIMDTLLSAVIATIDEQKCIIISAVDISENKRMQLELEKLDQLNLVGEIAASIGHEVRNPMTTVRGFLQMMKSSEDCQSYKEYYDLMIEEIDHGNRVISEFLSLARNKSSDLRPMKLGDIVSQTFHLVNAEALRQDKTVCLSLEDRSDIALDEKEIRQLILNLALNGLEAMEAGGRLKIRTHDEDGSVVLEVADRGKGIPQEVMAKLGTPFVTTKDGSVGLGLAICYSIAKRHNASIEFDTSPAGTTFRARFPRLVPAASLAGQLQ